MRLHIPLQNHFVGWYDLQENWQFTFMHHHWIYRWFLAVILNAMMFPGMAVPGRPAASRPAASALPVGRIDNAAAVLVSRPEWAPPRLETKDLGLNRSPLSAKQHKFGTQQSTHKHLPNNNLMFDGLQLNRTSPRWTRKASGCAEWCGWNVSATWMGNDGNMELPHFFLDDVIFASQVNALLPKEAGEHL